MCLVAGPDSVLEFFDHRTGCIDDFDAALLRDPVGAWRFTVRAKEYARVRRERAQVVVVNGGEAFQLQPRDLLPVMHDIA